MKNKILLIGILAAAAIALYLIFSKRNGATAPALHPPNASQPLNVTTAPFAGVPTNPSLFSGLNNLFSGISNAFKTPATASTNATLAAQSASIAASSPDYVEADFSTYENTLDNTDAQNYYESGAGDSTGATAPIMDAGTSEGLSTDTFF